MSELEVFNTYKHKVLELAGLCRTMSCEEYNNWRKETLEDTPLDALDFMKKIVILIDQFAGK